MSSHSGDRDPLIGNRSEMHPIGRGVLWVGGAALAGLAIIKGGDFLLGDHNEATGQALLLAGSGIAALNWNKKKPTARNIGIATAAVGTAIWLGPAFMDGVDETGAPDDASEVTTTVPPEVSAPDSDGTVFEFTMPVQLPCADTTYTVESGNPAMDTTDEIIQTTQGLDATQMTDFYKLVPEAADWDLIHPGDVFVVTCPTQTVD